MTDNQIQDLINEFKSVEKTEVESHLLTMCADRLMKSLLLQSKGDINTKLNEDFASVLYTYLWAHLGYVLGDSLHDD